LLGSRMTRMSEAQLRVLHELGHAIKLSGDDITKAGLSDEELARRLDMTVEEGHIEALVDFGIVSTRREYR
jgi:hypothetical protein